MLLQTDSWEGTVYNIVSKSSYQILYIHQMTISKKDTGILIYDSQYHPVQIGNRIHINGTFQMFEEARNPGVFDQRAYYERQNIAGYVWADHLVITDPAIAPLRQRLYQFRTELSKNIMDVCGEKSGGILCAMLLGERGQLDPSIRKLYQRNGIIHILAISGLHLSILGMLLFTSIRRLTGSYLIAGAAGFVSIVLYVLMIGITPAILRAFFMYCFHILAEVTGEVYDMPTAFAVSAAITLLWRPLAFYDAGFQFSYAALLGIEGIYTFFERKNKKEKRTILQFITDGMVVCFSIHLLTLPVLLYHYYSIPLYSGILNLLVLPLMSVLLLCGIAGSMLLCVIPVLGKVLLVCGTVILSIYERLCLIVQTFPYHEIIIGKPSIFWICVYYGLVLLCYIAVKRKQQWKYMLFFPFFLLVLWKPARLSSSLQITMLDVGQGDCFLIQTKEGLHMLVDGGSSSVKEVGTYQIEPCLKALGVEKLHYVFLSHGDQDHINGVEQLLRNPYMGIPIGHIVFPSKEVWEEEFYALSEMARRKEISVMEIRQGDTWQLGSITLQCQWPKATDKYMGNEASMVLRLSMGQFSMLFTGDLEREAEEEVLQRVEKTVCLKVGHHGSRYSTSASFLNKLSPELALISAGEGNSYGHPAKETMQKLEQQGCGIWCTKESGAVILKTDGKKQVTVTTTLSEKH